MAFIDQCPYYVHQDPLKKSSLNLSEYLVAYLPSHVFSHIHVQVRIKL